MFTVQWSPHIFSFHEVSDACTGRLQTRTPIKPLVGMLRHPYAHCSEAKGYHYVLNKSYLLPVARQAEAGKGRAYLFDLGASLYSQGLGGASQKLFDHHVREARHQV